MSAMGHEQTSRYVRVMSALLPIKEIPQCRWDVRKVPQADMGLLKALDPSCCLVRAATRRQVASLA